MIKVTVNYDFTQKELIGEREMFEVENMLEQELHDGDKIEFIYGFCGG